MSRAVPVALAGALLLWLSRRSSSSSSVPSSPPSSSSVPSSPECDSAYPAVGWYRSSVGWLLVSVFGAGAANAGDGEKTVVFQATTWCADDGTLEGTGVWGGTAFGYAINPSGSLLIGNRLWWPDPGGPQ